MNDTETEREKTVPCEIAELDKAIEATFKLATVLETGLVNVLLPPKVCVQADCEQTSIAPSECPLTTSVREFRHRVEKIREVLEETLLRLDAGRACSGRVREWLSR